MEAEDREESPKPSGKHQAQCKDRRGVVRTERYKYSAPGLQIVNYSFTYSIVLYRPNFVNKGKQQRDRRKLREKRRSTGVVHLQSTEVT